MSSYWVKIGHLGVDRTVSIQARKRIILLNRISLLAAGMSTLSLLAFLFAGLNVLAITLVLVSASFAATLLLNKLKQYLMARLWFTTVTNLILFYFALCFGAGAGPHLLLLYAAVMPWLLFGPKEKLYALLGSVLSTGLFYYFIVAAPEAVVRMGFVASRFLFLADVTVLIAAYAFTINYLVISRRRSERRMSKANETLREANAHLHNDLADHSSLLSFAEVMYNNNISSMPKLCNMGVRHICDLLSSTYGAVWVYDQANDMLDLEAELSFSTGQKREAHIANGETLAGDAYKNQKTIHLKKPPKGYLYSIQSGLGQMSPTDLIIIPMTYGDQEAGVLEIARTKPFTDADIELTKRLAEIFAANIAPMKAQEETRRRATFIPITNKNNDSKLGG